MRNKKVLLLTTDIGIAVKKIVTMLQKKVLPERTWNFFPFADDTANAALIKATVPASIWIMSKSCILV